MNYSHNFVQSSLVAFESMGFRVSEHQLVKISEEIEWEELIEEVSKVYAKEGRNSKSIRMMLGLEMAKVYFGVSDREIVRMLKTDAAVMVFCGFSVPPGEKEIPDSSSLTKFRNRLTADVVHKLSDLVAVQVIRKLPPRKRTQVASDSSCLPANIEYPTDTKVLSKTAEKLIGVLGEARKAGVKFVIRGRRTVLKTVKVFNKIRKKTKEQIREMKKELLSFNRKLIRKIKKCRFKLSKKAEKTVATAKRIVGQQIQMYKGKTQRVKNRIVSFHEEDIRPIYRGKAGKVTEFGKKISIMVVGQKVIVPNKCEYDNFSDTQIPKSDIEKHRSLMGRDPKEYSADRGMHSPANHNFVQSLGIDDGIQYRGKIPKKATLPSKTTRDRMYRQRSSSEAKLGTLKTRWGCAKIPYKSENTIVRFGIASIMHNLNWAANC